MSKQSNHVFLKLWIITQTYKQEHKSINAVSKLEKRKNAGNKGINLSMIRSEKKWQVKIKGQSTSGVLFFDVFQESCAAYLLFYHFAFILFLLNNVTLSLFVSLFIAHKCKCCLITERQTWNDLLPKDGINIVLCSTFHVAMILNSCMSFYNYLFDTFTEKLIHLFWGLKVLRTNVFMI